MPHASWDTMVLHLKLPKFEARFGPQSGPTINPLWVCIQGNLLTYTTVEVSDQGRTCDEAIFILPAATSKRLT